MNVGNIYVGTKVDTSGLRKDLNESQKKVKDSTNKMQGSLGLLKKAAVAAFAGWGISRVITSMGHLVSMAETQRKSVAGMETAMKSMGRYTSQMSKNLQDYAVSLQQVTNFGDEATMQGVKFLMTYRDITDELMFRSIKTGGEHAWQGFNGFNRGTSQGGYYS